MKQEGQIHPTVGHETSDASIRPILLTGLGLAVAVAIIGLIGYGMFHLLRTYTNIGARENPMAAGATQVPPEPRLEEHPAIALEQLNAQEQQVLSTYGWADRKTGRVRIPIDRAMELQLQRGFPARKELPRK
jgi:hypothetical protein